ncbi:FHA domain-containing protein [candidate division KSB1 bacterium]|nr:FHA domain-containing protein [candidate division KSB1 bacterium]
MAKLLVKMKAEVFKDYLIPDDKNSITIGSETDNDLLIEDKKISMKHLKISRKADTFYAEDLHSAFGTTVNGRELVEEVELCNGDEIKLGQHTLIFLENQKYADTDEVLGKADKKRPVLSESFEIDDFNVNDDLLTLSARTEIIEASSIDFDSESASEAPTMAHRAIQNNLTASQLQGSNGAQVPHYLLAIYGPYKGKKYQLNKDETRIGRDTKLNDIVIRKNSRGEIDSSISRRHATIFWREDGYFISDKRSKTRTFVNQTKVPDDDSIRLLIGDEIEIVSDQKSTIFRLVTDGEWNFAPPKKAGVWWIRFRDLGIKLFSVAILLVSIVTLATGIRDRNIITQRPDRLLLTEKVWHKPAREKATTDFFESFSEDVDYPGLAVADLNGDQVPDGIFWDSNGMLKALDGKSGTSLWRTNTQISGDNTFAPVLADLNNNGMSDIVILTRTSRLTALDGLTTAEIWRSPILDGVFAGTPVVADVDGDNRLDAAVNTIEGKIFIIHNIASESRLEQIDLNDSLRSIMSAADIEGDGVNELFAGSENGWIYIVNAKNHKIKFSIDLNSELARNLGKEHRYSAIRAPIAIGHLNDDAYQDFVISTSQGLLVAFDGKTRKWLWHDILVSQTELIDYMYYPVTLGDLDADNQMDVIVYTIDGRIKAYKGCGYSGNRKKPLWEYIAKDWEKYVSHPALADLNKDGVLDVIASGINTGLHLIDGKSGDLLWASHFASQNPGITSPLVADFAGDGYMDIILQRADQGFYAYMSNSRCPKNKIVWGQKFADARNAGAALYPAADSTATCDFKIIISLLMIGLLVGVQAIEIIKRKRLVRNASA